MGQLNDLLRAAKRATIIEVARKWHKEKMLQSVGKPLLYYHWASFFERGAAIEGARHRTMLRRYLRQKGLPTNSPLVPRTPI